MECYYDRNYGADADGNRGVGVWDCELTTEDEPEILEQLWSLLQEYSLEGYDVTQLPTQVITMINPYTEYDVEFEIEPKDFITAQEWNDFCAKEMEKENESNADIELAS